MLNDPVAYLITFTTYGTWLRGDERGSVDRDHNVPDTPFLAANPRRATAHQQRSDHPPVILDGPMREIVRATIEEVCSFRGWTLHALNVRTNHVHVVVTADQSPERVMNMLKTWCSRRMGEAGMRRDETRMWTRHGSTRYLWKEKELASACNYVIDEQGADLN